MGYLGWVGGGEIMGLFWFIHFYSFNLMCVKNKTADCVEICHICFTYIVIVESAQ